jgi:hypothetical protein
MKEIDFKEFIPRFDSILQRGLSHGLGRAGEQVCIEAAICEALNLPHGDNPQCVAYSVRSYKIRLNDSAWSSPQARARGLRDLGIAQLGSLDVVDDVAFTTRLAELTIRRLIPELFRLPRYAKYPKMGEAANRCEAEGSFAAADAAAAAAAPAADFAAAAADFAARAAADAAAAAGDHFLLLSSSLALQVLRELNAPGSLYLASLQEAKQ